MGAPQPSAMHARNSSVVDMRGVVQLLERVEDLGPGANGTLFLDGASGPGGAVFVDNRQICWAAGRGQSRRLTDMLIERSDTLSRDEVEEVIRACRASEQPIGQALVGSGLVTAAQLETALIDHTSESLIALSRSSAAPRWVEHRNGFSPRWRLAPTDALAHVAALAAGIAAPNVEWITEVGAAVVVYGRSTSLGIVPVATSGTDNLGVRDMAELGPWIASEMDLGRAIDGEARNVVLNTAAGLALSAWSEDDLLYAVFCPGKNVLPRVLGRYLERRR